MRGERWALVSVKLALLFLRACSRQPVFARLFSCAECTHVRSRRPVYARSFSPARVRALALTPGTSRSPRACCSQSRFSCAGPFRASLFARWSFAASLFARWLLRGLAFHTLAFCTSAVSANLDLHDFGLGELSAPQTPTTPSNSSSLALRALPLHTLILHTHLRRPAFACLFSTWWMELHSGVQGLHAGHVVEIFRQGIPDGLVEGFVDSKKILGRDCHHHHLALIITRYSHLFLINTFFSLIHILHHLSHR